MRVVDGEIIIEVGDVVRGVERGSGIEIGGLYTITDTSRSMKGLRLIHWKKPDSSYDTCAYQSRVVIAGECHKCIHACKMPKKCPLFEEVEK